MIAARSGRTDITNILLEGEHIDLDIQENVSVLQQALNTLMNMFSHKFYCLQTGGWSALHFSAGNGDSATTYALIKAGANVHLKDKVWDSHKFSFLQTLFSLSVQNGWTALEIAEVKSADEKTTIIPEWPRYMGDGYEGVRDYGIVIELLRGNLVEPVTPPTHHVSPLNVLSSSAVIHTAVLFLILLYCTVLRSLQLSEETREPSRRWWGDRDL